MTNLSALKPDTLVGSYKIIQAVDSNSYSVVYRARIDDTDEEILLQEFVPDDLVRRQRDDQTVSPQRGKDKIFEQGLALFLQEARILSQIRDPYIARVREYTKTRGTAFIAMDLEQGQSLDEHLKQVRKIEEKELRQLFVPLLKGLRVIHASNLLHRDINPKNIFIRDAGPPLILGFGSTQRALTTAKIGLESRVTPGFSPIEQYHEDGRVGPWTDLYGIGAVLYRCISGITPIDAPKRVTAIAEGKQDPLVPAMETGRGNYDPSILSSIDWLLQPVINKRPASADAILGPWAESHRQKGAKEKPRKVAPLPQTEVKLDDPQLYADPTERLVRTSDSSRSRNILASLIVALLVVGIGVFTFWPQIESITPGSEKEIAQSPPTIEGTGIPDDILDQPLPDEERPPELPKSLELTRKADNFRADEYRRIEQHDNTIRTLLQSARTKVRAGKLIAPARDNALEDYRAILIVDIDNVDALQGIDEITGILFRQARSQFDQGALETSQQTLDAMREAGIQTDDTLALRLEIREQYELRTFEEQQMRQDQIAEQERIRQQELAEQQRLTEAERLRQEKLVAQQKLAEAERLKQEKLAEQQRLAEAERLNEEKLAEQQKLAEAERPNQEKLAEQQRLAEAERLKQEKLAEQQRLAEAERLNQEKLAEQQRRAETERLRQEESAAQRLAEQERIKQEELAAQQPGTEQTQVIEAQDARVTQLLASAKVAVEKGLTDSSVENALANYREVLTIDPANEEAQQGISDIVGHYVDLANKALGKDRFREVENLLLLISAIDPQSSAVGLLRDQMKIRRQAIVQAQLQAQREQELEQAAQAELVKQKELEHEQRIMEQGINAYYRGDYLTAFDILTPLAEKGKERAQFRVGVMYLRGRGTEQNEPKGTAWIRKAFPAVQSAATSGEAWAQADLGSLYHEGLLVAQNDKEAARWYMLAAEQGYPGAQTNLGTMYANGEGVTRSRSEAIKWLKRAAAQGDRVAQNNLVALGVQ